MGGAVYGRRGISIKLSALHPCFEFTQGARVRAELKAWLNRLVCHSRDNVIAIDAEEADRLDLALDLFDLVLADPHLEEWEGFGVVV